MKKQLLVFTFLLIYIFPAQAQKRTKTTPAPKKPLTEEAYEEWKSITYRQLSPDGGKVAYKINPENEDGELVLLDLKTETEKKVPRAESIKFTWDGAHQVFLIKPEKELIRNLQREKKKKEDFPKDSLGLYHWQQGKLEKIPHIQSHKLPEKAGGWVAYQVNNTAEKDTSAVTSSNKEKKSSEENGFHLHIRKLDTGEEKEFSFVTNYQFAKGGEGIFFHSTGDKQAFEAGAYWLDLNNMELVSLLPLHPKNKIQQWTIAESGDKVSFIANLDTVEALIPHPKLYLWKEGDSSATLFADEETPGMPADWLLSPDFEPYFSKDGTKLFLGTRPEPIVKDTTLLPEEIVQVEVWHWQDEYIYPEQNRRLEREQKRNYLAVMSLDDKKLVQLGYPELSEVEVAAEGNGTFALGKDDRSYRMMRTWDISSFEDLYVVDLQTGDRTAIAKEVKGRSGISPGGNFVYWFNGPDTAWYTHDLANSKTFKLKTPTTVSWVDEENDLPDYASSYGMAGWTENDEHLLLYDRYDMWKFDPRGNHDPENLTKTGRENRKIYRYQALDPDEKAIDHSKPWILHAFDEVGKTSGYVEFEPKSGKLTELIQSPHHYSGLSKAREADRVLFTRESFREFPDLRVTDLSFSSPKRISQANPQQENYLWGTAELVSWRSLDNIPLEGILYKPDNFDPKRKYPMIVVYYEKFSNTLHYHHKPEPIRSLVNRTMYVSNDYLIFIPDIVYRVGYPGESAYNAIMPGVTSLIEQGFVDEENIGIQGHSWSGYQTAYILTRTNLFKAAEAGAIVANMTSAYGGIRWETGLARTFQYEKTQTRLGASLWDNRSLYIENSPLFYADKIETPLLLMHNDSDGHVPWYQGIEMYLAMRRLDKACWMLNYTGEPHWPVKRQNRIDFQTRMRQFFDHYLKDAPLPSWMDRGVPAIEKGIHQGLEYVD
jgi:dipeptidyl aminopeptidase/acylaminoacyl peptidase